MTSTLLAGESTQSASFGGIPGGTRSWEAVPSIIRNDGIETFRLEINVNGPVGAVQVYLPVNFMTADGATQVTIPLRDDGQGGDVTAGDFIYSTGPLHCNTNFPIPPFFYGDTNGPSGLYYATISGVTIIETDATANRMLVNPSVGLLDVSLPTTAAVTLKSNLVVTPHLINVQSTNRNSQKHVRGLAHNLASITGLIYQNLADKFDFLVFLSNDHIEYVPWYTINNYTVGRHETVKVNFTGTGQSMFSNNTSWGNPGRLLGVNSIDVGERGVYAGNVTHELQHQWSAYLNTSLGFTSGDGHYNPRSSAASLLGGTQFRTNGDGSFTINCSEGYSGATQIDPLDKYMMGLLAGSNVPTLRVYSTNLPYSNVLCDQAVSNFDIVLTITNIQAMHGVRSPGPATAQRSFSVGFVMESYKRLLTSTELTFFEALAARYGAAYPTNWPKPNVAYTWPPIGRFFGDDTSWHTDIPAMTNPLPSVERLADGRTRFFGYAAPSQTYKLTASTNLANWVTVSNLTTATNGFFQSYDGTNFSKRFYRLVWP